MAAYNMELLLEKKWYEVPVLPEKLGISSPGDNETVRVLGLGEVLLLRPVRLRELSWSSYLPAQSGDHLASASWFQPMEFIKALRSCQEEKQSVQLKLSNFNLGLSDEMKMAIEGLDYEERFGEPGDLYYTLRLREWRNYEPMLYQYDTSVNQVEPILKQQEEARSGQPESPGSYTVVANDSLWAIAQRFYGDGSLYPQLYALNQQLIDAANAGTGNSTYTIYPGQVLQL